jgi:hypothetical protein
LAECYFLNEEFTQALEAEKRALALAKGDRSHYEAQLQKFMRAIEKKSGGFGPGASRGSD